MNEKIIELEEYKNLIENKKGLDNGVKTVDDLSLEELEDVNKLYTGEVSKLSARFLKKYLTRWGRCTIILLVSL